MSAAVHCCLPRALMSAVYYLLLCFLQVVPCTRIRSISLVCRTCLLCAVIGVSDTLTFLFVPQKVLISAFIL